MGGEGFYGVMKKCMFCCIFSKLAGGEGGIRTHGTRKGSTVFETARFNRSRTSPYRDFPDFPTTCIDCHYADFLSFWPESASVTVLSLPPSRRRTAFVFASRLVCAYRIVVLMCACPRSSFTVTRSAPLPLSLDANVWRKVCHVTLGSPALRQAFFTPNHRSFHWVPVSGF